MSTLDRSIFHTRAVDPQERFAVWRDSINVVFDARIDTRMDSARFNAQVDATALICLGRVSHENTVKALGYKQSAFTFGHGARHYVEGPNGPLSLFDSYHCSRYNTNTGRLTEAMFHNVFRAARAHLDT